MIRINHVYRARRLERIEVGVALRVELLKKAGEIPDLFFMVGDIAAATHHARMHGRIGQEQDLPDDELMIDDERAGDFPDIISVGVQGSLRVVEIGGDPAAIPFQFRGQ